MKKLESIFCGRTFDDFLFRPQHGIVESRKHVNLTMPLSAKINIALPIIGANMDTVTGKEMMHALSLEGGFGFLDRHCSIEQQVNKVRYVKTRHSFIIDNPLKLPRQATIGEAKAFVGRHNISGILVEEEAGNNVLAGILSRKDICEGDSYDNRHISEFMTPFSSLVVSHRLVSPIEAEKLMFQGRVEKLPLVDENRFIKGLITMRDLRLSKQKPNSGKDEKGRLLAGAAIGASGDYLERAEELVKNGVDCILIDIAHADSEVMRNAIENVRRRFGESIQLVVGNIATAEAAKFLVNMGVDAVKVGIGPGKGCRTRLETGTGVPQLQAIREVFLAVDQKIPIISDGGTKNDKDIFMAIACGASTVMLGSMLSGTDESPGKIIQDPVTKQKIKLYRGMTSPEAVVDSSNGQEYKEKLQTPAEGQSMKVPYVGSVVDILGRIKGHLQSAVSYAGEESLYAAHKKITLDPLKYIIPLSFASQKESFDR